MDRSRLSVSVSEVSDDGSCSTGVLSSYEGAVTPPIAPAVTLGPIVVNAGGTGVLHGNVNSYTLNQYIVPVANGDATEWTSNAVEHLVTDAVKLSTDTKKKFFPNDDTQVLPGDKENLRSLQRKWCCLIAALIGLSLFTLFSTLIFTLFSFRGNGPLPFYEDESRLAEGHLSAQPQLKDLSLRQEDMLQLRSVVLDTSKDFLEDMDQTQVVRKDYDKDKRQTQTNPCSEELGMEGADLPGAPTLMSRASWVAQPSKKALHDNPLPADTVVVCHTASEPCNTTASCIKGVRYIQQFHIDSRGWDDIGYNYLVGGDNCVYVGRGWDKMGAHTKGHNNSTIGVAFIGTFDNQLPPPQQLEAFKKLLDLGVRLEKLTKDYKLVAQCQLKVTAAPGGALVKEISSWPHYDKSLPTSGCTTL